MSTDPTPAGDAPVVLFTHAGDYYTIDLVAEAVERRGRRAIRVDTDRFPAELTLGVRMAPGAPPQVTLGTAAGEVDLSSAVAIWCRRLWPAATTAPGLDPRFANACRAQARALFFEALPLLDRPCWVNAPIAGLRAESKLLQLAAARACGLRTPDTLVTNDPDAVRRFAAAQPTDLITKLLVPLSQTMDASGAFVYTSRLDARDCAALDDLRHAPQIFQPLIDKREELRVVVCGARIFAAAICLEGEARARVDWRLARPGEAWRWEPRELSPPVAAKLHALLARLGLVFGAVDLIDDGGPEPLFLEVNQAGEWGWLQRDLGFDIAGAIADELCAVAPCTDQDGAAP